MNTLTHRVLPGLHATVSTIGAGCWTIGGPATNCGVPIGWDDVTDDEAYRGLMRACELGITLYDTADVYGLGRSERLIGRMLNHVRRDDVVVSSKVGYFTGTSRHAYEPHQVRHQLATTLDNLNTDHLDIYILHSTDFGADDRYLDRTIEQLREFRQQKMIRAIGMRAPHAFAEEWAAKSGGRATDTRRWLHLFHRIRPDVVTVRYNLLSPLYSSDETDIFSFAQRHHIGVLIKQALGQGRLLRQRSTAYRTFSTGDHRTADPSFLPTELRRLDERLAPLRDRFGTRLQDIIRIALRYVIQHAPHAAVLVGFRNAEQIQALVGSLGDPLTEDEMIEIRALLHPNTSAAERFDRAVHRG
ncbi:aldo/keto reductase [Kibdelosporangium aridum]|uniref:aldo/keto reductase n=1 Tax=Kibdelosporangium aridum TaxID=2030 RepID=UPI00068A44E5